MLPSNRIVPVDRPLRDPRADAPPRLADPVAPARGRALQALFVTLACFAIAHWIVLAAHFARHRDPSVFNVFTMLEAQKLVPALAEGAAIRFLSFLFAFAVYALVYARLASPRGHAEAGPPPLPVPAPGAPAPHRNGTASRHPAEHLPMAAAARPRAARLTPVLGLLALVAGLALHMAALAGIEHFVRDFPAVPDVVQAALPYVDFGVPGEAAFFAFLVTAAALLFRRQPATVPTVLAQLGLFYAIRGVFLFLLPIGAPPTSPAPDERFVLWPYPAHAYFPGGHTGMMTVISLSVASARWRRGLLAATFLFAAGTVLARTHYVADALGGALVGYAVVSWSRRHLPASAPARRDVPGVPLRMPTPAPRFPAAREIER